MIVDAPAAHERIIFDRVINASSLQEVAQQELFPQTINFSAADFQLVKEIENDLRTMGFDLREFGLNTYVLHSTPAGVEKGNEVRILESVLEQYKSNSNVLSTGTKEKIASAIAKSMAIKKGMMLSYEEMLSLIRELELSPKGKTGIDGKRCVTYMTPTELSEKFK